MLDKEIAWKIETSFNIKVDNNVTVSFPPDIQITEVIATLEVIKEVLIQKNEEASKSTAEAANPSAD